MRTAPALAAALTALALVGCTAEDGRSRPPATAAPAPALRAPVAVPTDTADYAYETTELRVGLRTERDVAKLADTLTGTATTVTLQARKNTGPLAVVSFTGPATTKDVTKLTGSIKDAIPKATVRTGTVQHVGAALSAPTPAGFTKAARRGLEARLDAAVGGPFRATERDGSVTVRVVRPGLTTAALETLATTMAAALGVDRTKVTLAPLPRP